MAAACRQMVPYEADEEPWSDDWKILTLCLPAVAANPKPLLPCKHKPNSKTAANPSVTKKRTATTTTTTTTTQNSTPIWNCREILSLITLPKCARLTVKPLQRREKPCIYPRRGVSRNLIRPPTGLNYLQRPISRNDNSFTVILQETKSRVRNRKQNWKAGFECGGRRSKEGNWKKQRKKEERERGKVPRGGLASK